MTDALTNLPSVNALEAYLLTCKQPKLFVIDIKNFRQINLTHSDEGGNFVLQTLSFALLNFAQTHEMKLFRFCNDQFVLALDQSFELSAMEKLIFTLLDFLKEQCYTYQNKDIPLVFHIGISFDYAKALQKAQKALHVAKTEGQPFVTYSEFANTLMEEDEEKITQMVDKAISQQQIVLHFQSIIDSCLNVMYYESLVRLECYAGLQSPKLFLKIAREKNFFDTILKTTISSIQPLFSTYQKPFAINLSSHDLSDATRIAFLVETLAHQHYIIEIQCEDVDHMPIVSSVLETFKKAGIATALDNVEDAFLLTTLKAQSLDYIKVHGDIIRNLEIDEKARAKALSLLQTARHLGAICIATHINSQTSYEAAKRLGFEYFQGYSFELPHPL
ncbi:MAG: GGDEF domain-containing phosphodiesterase [Sulfurospirillaceae bacterium]|nr:GGDEF domain-containing phosphodiesterase [Sulfurospirillaceae bacterium]